MKGRPMAFKKADRQAIIDGYLTETGANMFVPGDFVDWLQGKPDHEAYEWFFGTGDADAAREHRILMARRMANGLRIVARVGSVANTGGAVRVEVREFPAFVSPMHGRKAGGGYLAFDPTDTAALAELRQQGITALRGWLARYRGAFEASGVSVTAIEEIVRQEEARVLLTD